MKRGVKIISGVGIVILIIIGVVFYLSYLNKSEKMDELVIEGSDGKVEKIEGAGDLDERLIERLSGDIKREEVESYLKNEIMLTEKAIENFVNDSEAEKRYTRRLQRLKELSKKIRESR